MKTTACLAIGSVIAILLGGIIQLTFKMQPGPTVRVIVCLLWIASSATLRFTVFRGGEQVAVQLPQAVGDSPPLLERAPWPSQWVICLAAGIVIAMFLGAIIQLTFKMQPGLTVGIIVLLLWIASSATLRFTVFRVGKQVAAQLPRAVGDSPPTLERGPWLTLWLICLIVANLFLADVYLRYPPDPVLGILTLANIVFFILIWNGRRAGFWGYITTSCIAFLVKITHVNITHGAGAFIGLAGPIILALVIQPTWARFK